MRKRSRLLGLVLLLCLYMILSLVGCHKTRSSQSNVPKRNSDALLLYYVDNASFQAPLLQLGWYRMQPDAVKIEAIGFESALELEEALEEECPDIILLDKISAGTSLNPFQWIDEGKIASLNSYMDLDEEYNEQNYIHGSMEAGKCGDDQYILPLSISTQYLLINESELNTGALSTLGKNPTVQRLMEELVRDAKAHEEELYFTHVPFYMDIMDQNQWVYELLEQSGALHVDHQDKKVDVDEELFEQTMKYVQVVLEDQKRMYENGADLATAGFMDIESYCTAVLTDRNAPLMTRYMHSACHQLLNQEMILLPYQLEDGSFVQSINVMGMVGAESARPSEAYQVLRKMMDMPADKWVNLTVDDALAHLSPVNVIEAQKLVDTLAEKSGGNYNILGSYFQREALTSSQTARLTEMIDNTEKMYIVDINSCSAVESEVLPYLQMQTEDWSSIAKRLAKAIENGM